MRRASLITAMALACATLAQADDLYTGQSWANVASDRNAARPGDVLTVVIFQSAEARNVAQNVSRTQRSFAGSLSAGSTEEAAALALDGGYSGQGEVRRSESFVSQISVTVQDVLANGDLLIAGNQRMLVNGETTTVHVSGRVRAIDIEADNRVLSSRIADAHITYDGEGFVSRNARPNFVHRLLGLLGLGG